MSNVVKGNGKVHATSEVGTVTLCNRVTDGLTDTVSDVTCKVCASRKPARVTIHTVITVNDGIDLARTAQDGRMRHRMVKRARDCRRAQLKALAAAL